MKKKFDKKIAYGLVFSFVLFGSIFYFTNNTLLLGASVSPEGKQASVPISGNGEIVLPPSNQPQSEVSQTTTSQEQQEGAAVGEESLSKQNTYIVKSGQTLWEIAQETGLSLTTLMNENQLSNSFIVEGQELSYN